MHCLVSFEKPRTKRFLYVMIKELRGNGWVKNIVPYNNTCSLADAVAKYAAYINKESNEIVFEQGYKPKPVEKRKVTTKTSRS